MTNAEIAFIMDAIGLTASHFQEWMKDYRYDRESGEYSFKGGEAKEHGKIEDWFNISGWDKPLALRQTTGVDNRLTCVLKS